LTEAAKVPGVATVTPLFFAGAKWQQLHGGPQIDAFVIGFDPSALPFAVADIERQSSVLASPDTMLVDDGTRSIFGPLTTGTVALLNNRKITIGGRYTLGTGFLGLGVAVMDEANFFRTFAPRSDQVVNLGLVTLASGVQPREVAAELTKALPDDMQVFTRPELKRHEDDYWTTRTSVGLIFGSGLVVSFLVGIIVLYQTLATQIVRHLPEFATLKAIGYSDVYLAAVVVIESAVLVFAGFVPAAVAAYAIYAQLRSATLLPLILSPARLVGVLAIALLMSSISATLSVGYLRRADPADVF
jgi:putative ABC transport system permease protein